MSDSISRQAAIDAIFNDKIDSKSLEIMTALGNGNEALTVNMTCDRHMQLLSKLPSAQPDRIGKWIETLTKEEYVYCTCSACKRATKIPKYVGWFLYDYCPNCGTKME